MKKIHVACAIIENDGKVLSTQRSETMSLPLKWEFPGGKIKDGESPKECLSRTQEELAITVVISRTLAAITHQYPSFTVILYPFVCKIKSGEIKLHEHKALAWLTPERLYELDWSEADIPLIVDYRKARTKRAYYSDAIVNFLRTTPEDVIGHLTIGSYSVEQPQTRAWREEISILRNVLASYEGNIYFEYDIPRMGRRIDVVLLIGPVIFVLEFKAGEKEFSSQDIDQVWDYALD